MGTLESINCCKMPLMRGGLGAAMHRPKFKAHETAAPITHPLLFEKNRPRRNYANNNPNENGQRAKRPAVAPSKWQSRPAFVSNGAGQSFEFRSLFPTSAKGRPHGSALVRLEPSPNEFINLRKDGAPRLMSKPQNHARNLSWLAGAAKKGAKSANVFFFSITASLPTSTVVGLP